MITQERLKHLLSYDPETGIFRNLRTCGKAYKDQIAGGPGGNGYDGARYWRIQIDGKRYFAHHLAWLYVFGEMPRQNIDHKDRNPRNNAILNLRLCNQSQNNVNSKQRVSKTGFRGVSRVKNSYQAGITVNEKFVYLGLFKTPEEAHLAYVEAATRYFGEFADMHLDALGKSDEKTGRPLLA